MLPRRLGQRHLEQSLPRRLNFCRQCQRLFGIGRRQRLWFLPIQGGVFIRLKTERRVG